MTRRKQTFTVGWLYPDLMNIYGDRGNILTLLKRAEWRDYEARLIELGRGTTNQMDEVDVFFFGGGQDVVGVVKAAQRQSDSLICCCLRRVHRHRDVVEAVQLDLLCRDVGRGTFEVAVGAAIDAVVAHVHGVEDQARATARAGPRVRGMGQLVLCHGGVVEAKPQGRVVEGRADFGHARVIGVEERRAACRQVGKCGFDLLRDGLELAITVELVPEEVEDEGRFGSDLVDRLGQARLVDLEDAPIGCELSSWSRAVEGGGCLLYTSPSPRD